MQKQHANTRMIATKAMETMAHDGTVYRANRKEFGLKCCREENNISMNWAKAAFEPNFQKVIILSDR